MDNTDITLPKSLITSSRAKGKMLFLALEVDTNGWKREREMLLLSVFSPLSYYNQYILPQRDLNPAVAKKLGVEIVQNKRVRKLVDTRTKASVDAKSLKYALRLFIKWLRDVETGTDGIVLFTFDRRRDAINILLEALQKYRLTEKFSSSVKGFIVLQDAAKVAYSKVFDSYTIRALSRILLNVDEDPGVAHARSIVTFQLMARLFGERQYNFTENRDQISVRTLSHVASYLQSVSKEVDRMKVQIRMYSLQPLLVGKTQVEKGRLYALRKYLAESGVDYMLLNATYGHKGKDGIESLIRTKLSQIKTKQLQMLRKALEQHFEM